MLFIKRNAQNIIDTYYPKEQTNQQYNRAVTFYEE